MTVIESYYENSGRSEAYVDGYPGNDDQFPPDVFTGNAIGSINSARSTSASTQSPFLSTSSFGNLQLTYAGSPSAASSINLSYEALLSATGPSPRPQTNTTVRSTRLASIGIDSSRRYTFVSSSPLAYDAMLQMTGENLVNNNVNYFYLYNVDSPLDPEIVVDVDGESGDFSPGQLTGVLQAGTYAIEFVSSITVDRYEPGYVQSASASLDFQISFSAVPEPSIVASALLIGAVSLKRRRVMA